jgi:hypothetical protein
VHEKRDMGEAVVTSTGRERLGGAALTKRWEDDDARRLQTRELSEPGGLYTGARMVGGSRQGQPTRAQCLAIEMLTGGAHTVVFPYSRIKPENQGTVFGDREVDRWGPHGGFSIFKNKTRKPDSMREKKIENAEYLEKFVEVGNPI